MLDLKIKTFDKILTKRMQSKTHNLILKLNQRRFSDVTKKNINKILKRTSKRKI